VIFLELALYHDIVDVCGDRLIIFEHFRCHSREGRAGVMQTLRHSSKIVSSEGCGETGFFFIVLVHPYLVVAGETIEQGQHFTPRCHVDEDADSG